MILVSDIEKTIEKAILRTKYVVLNELKNRIIKMFPNHIHNLIESLDKCNVIDEIDRFIDEETDCIKLIKGDDIC